MDLLFVNSCSICFEDFTDQAKAKPDVCDHVFCLQCLQKWGKHGSFCPIDRKRFKKIVNLSNSTHIPIKPKKRKKQPILYDISSHCEVCSKVQENDTLILCDCCDLAYHLACLTPPLTEVPPGIWHCPDCVAIDQKLSLRKGTSKKVGNHTNLGLSSEGSSSETNLANNQPNCSEVSSNFSNSKAQRRIRGKKSSSSDEICRFKKRFVRKTKSFSGWKLIDGAKKNNIKLHCLRRRVGKASLHNWSDSSDESQLKASNDSSTLVSKLKNHSEISTKVRNLRPRKKILYENSCNSSDTSNGFSQFFGLENLTEKNDTNSDQSNDLNVASPLFITPEKETDFTTNVFPSTYIENKTLPEATEASSNCEANGIINSNISITGSCSLNNYDNENFDTKMKSGVTNDNVPFNSDEKYVNPSVTTSSCSLKGYDNRFDSTVADDDISVIATVVKEPKSLEPKPKKEFECTASTSSKFVQELVSDDDLPDLDLIPQKATDGMHNGQQASTSKMKPVFSVFEKLEDEGLAQKNYSEINKALKLDHPVKQDSAVLVRKELPDSFKVCSKNTTELKHDASLETNELSKELRAIEKNKWNARPLTSENNCRPLRKSRCCKRYGKNRYNSSDVVHIGRYFCQKKYSDNYKELRAITKSLNQKPKWSEKDIVIINRKRNDVEQCSKEPKMFDSRNILSSGLPNHSTSQVQKYPHHEIISFDQEGLQSLIQTQAQLLRSTLCFSNLKQLSVQKDGSLFLNWQKKQV